MSTQPVRLAGKFLRKLTGVGVRLFLQSKRLVYRRKMLLCTCR